MSGTSPLPPLFPLRDTPADAPPAFDPEYRKKTGIFPSQELSALVNSGEVGSLVPISEDQIQPASIDLRLGARAYRVQASFLPGPKNTVLDRVTQLDGMPPIDLTSGAVLERG